MGRKRGGGGGGTTVVNQSSAPWRGQEGPLLDLFGTATALRHVPRVPFPGRTFAPFDPAEIEAMQRGEARARAGSPVSRASQAEIARVLGGGYLYGGPGFNAAVEAAQRQVLPQVRGAFPKGRFGSRNTQAAETQALTDVFARQYGQERQNMMAALQMAPALAGLDYEDLARLSGIGETRRDMAQDLIDEQIARHEFTQNEPTQRLRDFQSFIQGGYGSEGGSMSTGIPMRGSRLSSLFGGALGGGFLGSMFPGASAGSTFGPWGAAIGAGLGLGGLL